MLKEYHDESEDQDDMSGDGDESDEAPELITSRSDFDSIVHDFLSKYEILGRKMRLKLEGETGPEKLDILRQALGQDEQVRIADVGAEEEEDIFLSDQEDEKAKWDCETILCMFIRPFYLESHVSLFQQPIQILEITHVLSVLETPNQSRDFNSITRLDFP
jgi:protein LTV1